MKKNNIFLEGLLQSLMVSGISLLLFLWPLSIYGQQNVPQLVEDYYQKNGAEILNNYVELLKIPNLQSDEQQLRANAEWIRDALKERGASSKLLELDGAPTIVYGTLTSPKAKRTLGIYIHYDGQPVDTSKWQQSPWTPTLYNKSLTEDGIPITFPKPGEALDPEWRIYGRSAADDKSPIAALLMALDVLQKNNISLQSNLTFFMEGEEEAGSPHLADYIDKYKRLLEVDIWLIFDGPSHQTRLPQLVFGVRGSTGLEITTYGADRYLHSGHYGNWAPNPAMRLAQLLATMKNEAGEVTIDGFYDSSDPIEASVDKAAASIPPFEDGLRKEFGLAESEENNAPYLYQMLKPALEIRGIESAAVGALARNVIPPTAIASINLRLVKGNDPGKMVDLVENHIRKQGYHIVYDEPTKEERLRYKKLIKVRRQGGSPAFRTSMDIPVVQWVQKQARQAAKGDLVLMPTMGGTLPLYLFEEKLAKPIVITPIANFDNNQHGPNENLRLGNLQYGATLMALLFSD